MTSIGLIAFFLLVIAPVLRVYMPKIEESDALLAEQLIDGELSMADRKALEEGESLDEIKAKLKPKKSAISADMLDTANSYDDKVAVVRLLVAEDAGRVANVLKRLIKPVEGSWKMAEAAKNIPPGDGEKELPDFVREELETMTTTERAAVIMLLMGETQASDIIRYMNPREVQALGSAMVGVVDLSQETVSEVLDDFVGTIKQQTNLGLGTTDYVESVLKRTR